MLPLPLVTSLEKGREGESPQSFSVYSGATPFLCGSQRIENGYCACQGGARSPLSSQRRGEAGTAGLPAQPVLHCVTLSQKR